jgi:hypothetical protein
VFKIAWLADGGNRRDIGGTPMFAPGPVATVAGEYVVNWIWPQISRDNPELSGFVLVDIPSLDEVFRWKTVRDRAGGMRGFS